MTIIDKGRGTQTVHRFENGYGASVISDGYGRDQGLYEIAVLQFDGDTDKFHLTYQTPITDDVLGYLTDEQVAETLARIEALTPGDVLAEQANRKRAEADRLREQIAELEAEIAALEA